MELELASVDLLEVSIKLPSGEIKLFNIEEELAISETDLNRDFIQQPGKFAWWASLAESAKEIEEKLEVYQERVEGEADKRARRQLEVDGVKVTEGSVKSMIKTDEELMNASLAYNRAKKNAATLKQIVKAFEQRKEMLISLGAHIRDGHGNNNDFRSRQDTVR